MRSEPPIAAKSPLIGGLIALVAAAMAFLAVAAAEAGLAADRIAGTWTGELARVATVSIAAATPKRDEAMNAALTLLRATPGVAEARALTEEETQALLSPWLGPDADVAALPLPALIDVALAPGAGPDVADLRRKLSLAAPSAVYDDHDAWRAPLADAAEGLRWTAILAVALTIGALAVMVGVATAATLWSGSGVLRTLRLIGAEDGFIARAFERPFSVRAAIGAAVGAAAALLTAAQVPRIEGLETLGAAAAAGYGPTWGFLAVAPLIAGATAMAATRITAYFVLRRG